MLEVFGVDAGLMKGRLRLLCNELQTPFGMGLAWFFLSLGPVLDWISRESAVLMMDGY